MKRLSPFGYTPVIFALGIVSVIVCLIPSDDHFTNSIRLPLRVILSILASIFFILPVYIISVFIAKKRIGLHLFIALIIYPLVWFILLSTEQPRSFSFLVKQTGYRAISYGSLYIVFFMTILLVWKISMKNNQIENGSKES